jgi:hypothetical protein
MYKKNYYVLKLDLLLLYHFMWYLRANENMLLQNPLDPRGRAQIETSLPTFHKFMKSKTYETKRAVLAKSGFLPAAIRRDAIRKTRSSLKKTIKKCISKIQTYG